MKKSKIKMLTAAACLALVGTASAAWVYAGTATASANIGVKVASYASAGEITVTGADNYYLYLDNGSVTWNQKEAGTNLVATHSVPSTLDQSGKNTTLTYTVTLTSAIAEYVKFSDASVNNECDSDDNGSTRTSKDIEWTSGSAITLPALEWVTINESESSYNGQTYDKSLVEKNNYTQFIEWLNGTGVGDDWTGNEEFDFENLVTINFTATVTNS